MYSKVENILLNWIEWKYWYIYRLWVLVQIYNKKFCKQLECITLKYLIMSIKIQYKIVIQEVQNASRK